MVVFMRVMVMAVLVVMIMMVMMVRVAVLMNVSVGCLRASRVLRGFGRDYVDPGSGDSAAQHFAHLDARAYVERCGCLLQKRERNARIDQRAQQHVAADAGKALQKADSHRVSILKEAAGCAGTCYPGLIGQAARSALRAAAGEEFGGQQLVERAGAEAGGVERYESEAGFL